MDLHKLGVPHMEALPSRSFIPKIPWFISGANQDMKKSLHQHHKLFRTLADQFLGDKTWCKTWLLKPSQLLLVVAFVKMVPLPKTSGQGWKMPCSRRRRLRKSKRSRSLKTLNSRLVLFFTVLHMSLTLCIYSVWLKTVFDWNIHPRQSGLIFHGYFLHFPHALQYLQCLVENPEPVM